MPEWGTKITPLTLNRHQARFQYRIALFLVLATLCTSLKLPDQCHTSGSALEAKFTDLAEVAAVDKKTPAPEVDIPIVDPSGQSRLTKRGALSYSVARAIEGVPGTAGAVSRNDLFKQAKQTVLQYSQNKQLIVSEPSTALGAVVWRSAATPVETTVIQKPLNDQIRVLVFKGDASALANVQPFFHALLRCKEQLGRSARLGCAEKGSPGRRIRANIRLELLDNIVFAEVRAGGV